ncbi:MAG: hypothetical protein ABIT23_05335 [Nitrosospira sp.]
MSDGELTACGQVGLVIHCAQQQRLEIRTPAADEKRNRSMRKYDIGKVLPLFYACIS